MRIEDYGLIGDLQTAALVGLNGSIDWLCFPRFDSGACFSALLGDEWDGRWLLAPDCEVLRVERRYRERTLVHELDFHCESGSVRVIDFMPPRGEDPDVVRIVEGLEGSVPMRLELVIRFEYGSIVPWVRRLDDETRVAIAGPGCARRCARPCRCAARTCAPSPSSPSRRDSASRSCSPGTRRIASRRRRSMPEQSLERDLHVLARVARQLHVLRPLGGRR